MNQQTKLSLRCHPGNENHHIWDNNGTFWCHLTVHLPDFTKRRLRLSLETHDIKHARRLRDALFALFGWNGRIAGATGSEVPLIGEEMATRTTETLAGLQQRLLHLGKRMRLHVG